MDPDHSRVIVSKIPVQAFLELHGIAKKGGIEDGKLHCNFKQLLRLTKLTPGSHKLRYSNYYNNSKNADEIFLTTNLDN